MKKEISDRLRKIAAALPKAMEKRPDEILVKGSELLLTPLAEIVTNREDFYRVEIPKFVEVNHQANLMEIWKADGWPAVDIYCLELLKEAGLLKGVDIKIALEKKNGIKLGDIK